MIPFWNCLGPLPKYCLILLKLPGIVSSKTTVFQKPFRLLNFGSNGMQLKFTVSVHISAQYTNVKPKILVKVKIYAKAASLGIINNVTPRSQKNNRVRVKLSQKTFSGLKLFLNYHYGSKGHHKFSQSL